MRRDPINKFRAAAEVLQRGRDMMMDALADDIVHQAETLLDSSFLFNEFLETQGTRVHFLTLLLSQLEQSAEILEESQAMMAEPEPPPPAPLPEEPPPAPRKRKRTRSKKVSEESSTEGTKEDL